MARTLWVVLIAYTLAFSFQSEDGAPVELGSEDTPALLGESEEIGNMAHAAKAFHLTEEDAKGMALLKSYQNNNKHLQETEAKLREKLSHPAEVTKGLTYGEVPGFEFTFQGRRLKGKSRSACELVCSTYSACKSYSYSREKRECVWSLSSMKMDPDFTLYSKLRAPESSGKVYSAVPGLLGYGKIKKAVKNVSLPECKYSCTKLESCKTFSYSATKKECITSGKPLTFSNGFTYYEKNIPLEPPWKTENRKENEHKDKLKKSWLKASTKASRAKLEKQAKAVKKLEAARKKAVATERTEKATRKTSNADLSKYKMARAQAGQAMKENMVMMTKVARANQKAIRLSQMAEKTGKVVKTKKHYEGRSKAKLADNLARERAKESKKKHAGYKKLEAKIKVKKKKAFAAKTKLKAASVSATAAFKRKEGKMKKAEAGAKLKERQKREEFSEMMTRKTKAAARIASGNERKAKVAVAKRKGKYENAIKADKKASTEIGRKASLGAKKRAHASLKKAEENEKGVQILANKMEEKFSKSNEIRTKKLEKDNKAEKVVKQRVAESNNKKKRIEMKKKAEIKKEKAAKAEKIAKVKKKKELAVKKLSEQKKKGELKIKKVKSDEQKKKKALRSKESSYKGVEKSQEGAKKAKHRLKVKMKHLKTNEIKVKHHAHQDALRRNVLMNQAKAAKERQKKAKVEQASRERHKKIMNEQRRKAATRLNTVTSEGSQKAARKKMAAAQAASKASRHRNEKSNKKMKEKKVKTAKRMNSQKNFKCVQICHEGRSSMTARKMAQLSVELKRKSRKNKAKKKPKGGRRLLRLRASLDDTVEMLSEDEDRRMTHAQKRLAQKRERGAKSAKKRKTRAKAVPVNVKFKKKAASFSYKGCKC